ncbi:MAG: hypothetical protein P8O92_09190 [Luminiphilus sp.]|nr:hypothetical protein [Luminiphilus sp.]|tara:strand:- start:132 stop:548 length:417 start_codon:yes stop_codon:yes gene_type:complete
MKIKIDVYMLCELIVFSFALAVIVHTVTVARLGGSLLTSDDAVALTQELILYRAALTGFLLLLYVSYRILKKNTTLVLKVIALISWVAFIEDLIAMDDVFFTPELITGQITQILRPVYLMAILFMVFRSSDREVGYAE